MACTLRTAKGRRVFGATSAPVPFAYEALHPETKACAVRAQTANLAMGHNVDDKVSPTFTLDTATRSQCGAGCAALAYICRRCAIDMRLPNEPLSVLSYSPMPARVTFTDVSRETDTTNGIRLPLLSADTPTVTCAPCA